MAELIEEPVVVGGTYNWELTASKDGVVWDITGGAVLFYLRDPSGNVAHYTASITDPTVGVAGYVNAAADIDEAGVWSKRFKVTVAAIVQFTGWEDFLVEAAP